VPDLNAPPKATRHRLPDERASLTHKFGFGGQEGYITVGLYPNGQPGEVFIRMAKEGSTISGLMDSFATLMSVALQHGVPLQVMTEKLAHTRFEPSGWTGNEKMGYAKSPMDTGALDAASLSGGGAVGSVHPSFKANCRYSRKQQGAEGYNPELRRCADVRRVWLTDVGKWFLLSLCVRELERMQLAESALTS
jgi:hypothetical protein